VDLFAPVYEIGVVKKENSEKIILEIQKKLIRPCLRHFSIEDLNGKIIAAHSIAL
jgi:hypothetical protein